ncbi:AI-2E family transporter [Shimia ponticola]|uniref:AI-2E family transporter n=1 Tax=Shimia ponticola TaxID=2582893 RepID=UPI0011BD6C00|nr:AI-2E family transporter [Shimia ponticola]
MGLPTRTQATYWGIAGLILALALWYLGAVIMPFIVGAAIAYFLDPVADRLEALGASRVMATVIISVVAVFIFILAALLVIPSLVQQALSLFDAAPQIFTNLRDFLIDRYPELMVEDSVIRQSLATVGTTIQNRGGELVNTLLSSAAGVLNIVLLFVIVPVVAFYLLLDWDRMVAEIDRLVPRDHLDTVRNIARDVDSVLAGFVRGMGTVCLILGTYYAVALMVVGLQFGLVVGFIAGLVTFIPYLGAIIGGLLAIGLALFQFWGPLEVDGEMIRQGTDWVRIGIVAAIFVIGQMVEGNILTPKLVGNSVGLHPVWLLLALSVFGALFGFVGLLVAVPVAAALGVLARFFVNEYQKGRLYKGLSHGQSNSDAD